MDAQLFGKWIILPQNDKSVKNDKNDKCDKNVKSDKQVFFGV